MSWAWSCRRSNAELRVKFQIKDSVRAGVVIGKVDPETPAAEQHLAPGDVIVEINRQPVTRRKMSRRHQGAEG